MYLLELGCCFQDHGKLRLGFVPSGAIFYQATSLLNTKYLATQCEFALIKIPSMDRLGGFYAQQTATAKIS